MAFSLELVPSVKAYLFALPGLTRQERVRLFTALNDSLRQVPDDFRADPENRTSPGAPHFVWDILLRGDSGGILAFRFFVDDSSAAYGLLRAVYAERL